MFCHACDEPLVGRFCAACGTRCTVADDDSLTLADVVDGWRYEQQLGPLCQWPVVREAVESAGRQATRRMTGEELLALADKLVPQAISTEGVAAVAQLLFTRLGVKTDQRRERLVPAPIGEAIVRALCSLARRGQKINNITQAHDGCVFAAAQPSDVWSLSGTLIITLRRRTDAITEVTALATIPGQIFDWGKNHRALETLFSDLTTPLQLTQRAA
jgi:hypothetical protein